MPSLHRRVTLAACAVLLVQALAGLAAGKSLTAPPNEPLGSVAAPAGEPLHVHGTGTLVVDGNLSTAAVHAPGADGPAIVLEADRAIVLTGNASLEAADGRSGADANGTGTVHAGDGGDGGDIRLRAEQVRADGALVSPGDGGPGGHSHAIGAPDALAIGGAGGDAGQLRVEATLSGALDHESGDGGDGGLARAQGEDGEDCTEEDGSGETDNRSAEPPNTDGSGQDANATAEDGACGPVDGTGGKGGDAEARGGPGGTAPNGTGGTGGAAYAIGGKGGDGMDACFETIEAAEASNVTRAGHGGTGGGAVALGGDGGPGLVGGTGGLAFSKTEGGDGGNSTSPPLGTGSGGPNFDQETSRMAGEPGQGGPGVDGGGGGPATIRGIAGDGGDHCGPLPTRGLQDVPVPGLTALVAIAVVAVSVRTLRPTT